MDGKYMKVVFTDQERAELEQCAKNCGKKVNEFVRECALQHKQLGMITDLDKLEAHTKAIQEMRDAFNNLFSAKMDDKILLSGVIEETSEKIYEIEFLEARIYRGVRNILSLLRGEPIEEGEENDTEL